MRERERLAAFRRAKWHAMADAISRGCGYPYHYALMDMSDSAFGRLIAILPSQLRWVLEHKRSELREAAMEALLH